MLPVAIRPARRFDAGAMAALLNALPGRTGPPVDAPTLRDWIGGGDIWQLAERGGDLRGFQWTGPRRDLPPDIWEIATFMAPSENGIHAGSALFGATHEAARARGIRRIAACYACDNAGARAYYGSRGFEEAGEAFSTAWLAARPGINQVVRIYRL